VLPRCERKAHAIGAFPGPLNVQGQAQREWSRLTKAHMGEVKCRVCSGSDVQLQAWHKTGGVQYLRTGTKHRPHRLLQRAAAAGCCSGPRTERTRVQASGRARRRSAGCHESFLAWQGYWRSLPPPLSRLGRCLGKGALVSMRSHQHTPSVQIGVAPRLASEDGRCLCRRLGGCCSRCRGGGRRARGALGEGEHLGGGCEVLGAWLEAGRLEQGPVVAGDVVAAGGSGGRGTERGA
jgi:hypothetical protein